jgi:hypothetical protein
MRMGICGTRMVRPNSSTTSRMAGAGAADAGGGVKDCARTGKAPSKSKAEAKM